MIVLGCLYRNIGLGQQTLKTVKPGNITNPFYRNYSKLVNSSKWYLRIKPTNRSFKYIVLQRFKSTSNKSIVTAKDAALKIPKKSDVNRLFSIAKPERFRLVGSIVLLVISSAVTLAVPFSIGKIIDIIYTQKENGEMVDNLTKICQILLGVFVVGALANFGRGYLMNTSGQRIIKRMREGLYASIIRQEIAFFDKNKTGELINRLSADTAVVGSSITNNISDGLRSFAQAVGGITMMVYVSPKLTCVALVVVPPIMLVSIFYGRYVRGISKNVQDALAESSAVAEERLGNMRTVRAFAQEEKEFQDYNKRISYVQQLSYKEALASSAFWGFTGFSGNIIILSVFFSGGLMMNEAQITVGDLTSFMMYAAYIGISMSGMSRFYSETMRAMGASSRIWQLIDRSPLIPLKGGMSPSGELQGDISFDGVHFTYPSRPDVSVLQDLTLHVPPGQVLAVVGASGSGKSTLASLLLRFYDPNQGTITIDGFNSKDLNPSWLRSHMGFVNQEPTLFSCSIAENIAYGAENLSTVTTEMIMEAAQKANALQFVESFPDGIHTMVGEKGIMLSGGQKQRIAIARAILKDPKILLLDEATSALDAQSEYLVQEALERVMIGRTVITIAHRLSTIRNADSIAVLDRGHVAEKGSYEELMGDDEGLFRRLVERQTVAYR